ncbi:adenine phosphoribosyltransferase 5 isoform X3 [Gossypium raimondii]|uniref:adenine phosphoribosyltransferase n=1 Tax=Gossypium hirsutum TaxID=3635 RepID=A0ABM3A421_GOSHI|nr:adenine phosphoribosyltransferase 5 isoform X3 [Gossypium hirsutum]XP_052486302.1 adenine phosphoribosyltransferase 5 isoform X3 [Gossypium raimondii]
MFAGDQNGLQGDPRLKAISEAIRVVPHFPKPGIMFQDITTLLLDHKAFKDTVDIFVDRYRDMGISVVAGVEARGFMFGPSIALAIGAKFVPLRKPRKLPVNGVETCRHDDLILGASFGSPLNPTSKSD